MASERAFLEPADDVGWEDELKMQDECGVFGCVSAGMWPTDLDVAHIICLGLLALQHRGQESAGIVTSKGDQGDFNYHKGMGLVSNVFSEEIMRKLQGNLGIGHNRYSTAGKSELVNCQPFMVHTVHGLLALAHNGELVNSNVLRRNVLGKGVGLSTTSDSELITQLLSVPPAGGEPDGANWPARIRNLMLQSHTAYSILIMYRDVIYGVRDPYGNRPLCVGKMNLLGGNPNSEEAEGYVISSESCAFRSIGATYVRDVDPGEIVEISKTGIRSVCIVPRPRNEPPAFCIFEYVYFARPDSIMEEQMVYSVRRLCGKQLALESPVDADIVSTVPESATPAALGFAEQSGIPYTEVLSKNRYVGRTFIQPSVRLRQLTVAKKFGPLKDNYFGKKIVLIDDSIVRGTTIGLIIKMLKDTGATEVHIRIASPPIRYPCYMGINIPTKEELIANKLNPVELAKQIGATSLVHLSVEGLVKAVQEQIPRDGKKIGHCTACLTGNYPVELEW